MPFASYLAPTEGLQGEPGDKYGLPKIVKITFNGSKPWVYA